MLYSFEEIAQLFGQLILLDCEPELELRINDLNYMIIGYEDHVSFQRCRNGSAFGSGELVFPTLQDLYHATTVDGICLTRDWNNIQDMNCYDFDFLEHRQAVHELKKQK